MSTTESLSPVTDVASAAKSIEGLLDLTPRESSDEARVESDETGGKQEFAEVDETEVNAAPDEDPASEQDDDAENDPTDSEDEPPVIEVPPPSSWSADEKALFQSLPLEAQQVVARRETERDKAISQRMNQLADQRKSIETQVEQASQAQNQYAQTLNQLLTLSVPELQQIENVDWMKLAQDDPTEYVRRTAIRDSLRQRVGFMQSQMQQVQNEQTQQMQARHQEHLAQQYETLIEQIPEFKDTSKAQALVQDIGQTMSKFGFTEQEISSVADARIVRVMAEMARLTKLESSRKSALAKKSPAQAPRLIQSNAASSRDDNTKRKVEEQFARLRKTGDVKDAARLIENMI